MHKKIVELATRTDDSLIVGENYFALGKECKYDGCFVAGTLVHTDKGLVPIEQIKVGDMVLSKDESGQGKQEYKPVVNIFKSENIPIFQMSYFDISNPMNELKAKLLYITAGHLIWIVQDENENIINDWIRVESIAAGSIIELSNGNKAYASIQTVFRIDAHIGYSNDLCNYAPEIILDLYDNEIKTYYIGENSYITDKNQHDKYSTTDFSDETIVPADNHDIIQKFQKFIDMDYISVCDSFTATVYNLEVADFHTYYVGCDGIWVHNTRNSPARAVRIG